MVRNIQANGPNEVRNTIAQLCDLKGQKIAKKYLKMAKITIKWPKMTKNGQKWPKMVRNAKANDPNEARKTNIKLPDLKQQTFAKKYQKQPNRTKNGQK